MIILTVKAKKVELIELFYNLIFVYAISRLTSIISEHVNGVIAPFSFFAYIITSFVILQAWLYFTNYVNRYGQWKWYEYIIAVINMIAVIYMANTIGSTWNYYLQFNISMLVMLFTVVILYSVHAYCERSLKGAAGNSITILLVVCSIYIISSVAVLWGYMNLVIWLNVLAILTGAFLPFFIKGKFDKSIINFPHLAERFELLTIITFGESVVGMTHFFDVNNFSPLPILVFLIIITMFGSYVLQIHNLINHDRVERSLRLMFSHYFIVISINLVTVALELINGGEISNWVPAIMLIVSLAIFYISIMVNKEYYYDDVELTKKDIVLMILVTLVGMSVILIFINSLYGFLIGALIITLGNFGILLRKYQNFQILIRK